MPSRGERGWRGARPLNEEASREFLATLGDERAFLEIAAAALREPPPDQHAP
jgi:hypothetical protein